MGATLVRDGVPELCWDAQQENAPVDIPGIWQALHAASDAAEEVNRPSVRGLGWTPLQSLAVHKDESATATIRLLLAAKADPLPQNALLSVSKGVAAVEHFDQSPLGMAIKYGNRSAVRLLGEAVPAHKWGEVAYFLTYRELRSKDMQEAIIAAARKAAALPSVIAQLEELPVDNRMSLSTTCSVAGSTPSFAPNSTQLVPTPQRLRGGAVEADEAKAREDLFEKLQKLAPELLTEAEHEVHVVENVKKRPQLLPPLDMRNIPLFTPRLPGVAEDITDADDDVADRDYGLSARQFDEVMRRHQGSKTVATCSPQHACLASDHASHQAHPTYCCKSEAA